MFFALSRSIIYQFLSRLFLYPESPYSQTDRDSFSKAVDLYISHFLDGVETSRRDVSTTADETSKFAESASLLSDLLGHLSLEGLQAEHRGAFGHTLSKDCSPYETQYGADLIFQQTQRLADISAFYKAFGLILSDKAQERHDHISVEFEFLAYLSYKQEYALINHGQKGVQMCLDAEKEFMKSHLIRWTPAFIILLRQKVQSGLYQIVADFIETFLQLEVKLLEIPMESPETYELKPASFSFEPDGSCFSCGVKEE